MSRINKPRRLLDKGCLTKGVLLLLMGLSASGTYAVWLLRPTSSSLDVNDNDQLPKQIVDSSKSPVDRPSSATARPTEHMSPLFPSTNRHALDPADSPSRFRSSRDLSEKIMSDQQEFPMSRDDALNVLADRSFSANTAEPVDDDKIGVATKKNNRGHWLRTLDKNSGRYYYWNTATRESRWNIDDSLKPKSRNTVEREDQMFLRKKRRPGGVAGEEQDKPAANNLSSINEYLEKSYEQSQSTIFWSGLERTCGWSTAISCDGTIAVLGCHSYNRIFIYRYDGTKYALDNVNSTIPEKWNGNLGYSLAVSATGEKVIFTAENANSTEFAILCASYDDGGIWVYRPIIHLKENVNFISSTKTLDRIAVSLASRSLIFRTDNDHDYVLESTFHFADKLEFSGNGSLLAISDTNSLQVARFDLQEKLWNVFWTLETKDVIVDSAFADDARVIAVRSTPKIHDFSSTFSIQFYHYDIEKGAYHITQVLPPLSNWERANFRSRPYSFGVEAMQFSGGSHEILVAGFLLRLPGKAFASIGHGPDNNGGVSWRMTSAPHNITTYHIYRHRMSISVSRNGNLIIIGEASIPHRPSCTTGMPRGLKKEPGVGFVEFWRVIDPKSDVNRVATSIASFR